MKLCEDSCMNLRTTTEYLNRTIVFGFDFFYDKNEKEPIDLLWFLNNGRYKLKPVWYLSRFYEFDNPILIKEMTISGFQKNHTSVTIDAHETVNFESGKYTHQPVLILRENNPRHFGHTEGNIIFRSHIHEFSI